jgi:hypothetical protein
LLPIAPLQVVLDATKIVGDPLQRRFNRLRQRARPLRFVVGFNGGIEASGTGGTGGIGFLGLKGRLTVALGIFLNRW